MAEEAMDDGMAGGRRRGSKKLIFLVLIAILVMVGTAAGLYFSGIASTPAR